MNPLVCLTFPVGQAAGGPGVRPAQHRPQHHVPREQVHGRGERVRRRRRAAAAAAA
eukprot:CAMPEP_0206402154 /NCGR_PEP_ID=MMETSP0294-20121207/26776_1 /ASSEMBLY_ACC=CAM_ASM_000327 /TAXON_ID=39354 /ORGANISM="Heterosigma akashiwo, Strain CCMP2393" /LENGTH=55 /DNA_ID=CAMNT_0053859151 /DNA_START=188 /DNA_END=352 /DNA_ORIENTATION=+